MFVVKGIYNNLPNNPFGRESREIVEIVNDNSSDGSENIERLHSITNTVEDNISIEKDSLILKINLELEKSKENYGEKIIHLTQEDKKVMVYLQRALIEAFTGANFMVKKVINKNLIDLNDRTDLEDQYQHLEELNNICSNIYGKYRRKQYRGKNKP